VNHFFAFGTAAAIFVFAFALGVAAAGHCFLVL
jgi:hypothetical protein